MSEYMTEGTLGDILDIVDGAKNIVNGPDGKRSWKKNDIKGNMRSIGSDYLSKSNPFKGSITSQAKKLIASFPVICSSSIDVKTACLISKALERKYVMLLEMLFSSTVLAQLGPDKTAADYLNQFFNNLDFSTMNVDDVNKLLDMVKTESALVNHPIKLSEMKEYSRDRKNDFYEETISESSIQDFRVNNYDGKIDVYTEKTDDSKPVKQGLNDLKSKVKLTDSDVKKANELVPAMLVIDYMADVNGAIIPVESIIGVKTRLVPVSSTEIVDKIYTKNKDSHGLLNLFRATTGEIKFFKDFLLAIDKAKVDAISKSKKGSVNPIWKVLEKRSLTQKMNKASMRQNDAAPITSLVITQEEVEYLKKQYNINMDQTATAKQILDAYNLLCFVVVDETSESAKFLFDSEEWEILSFNSLEREGNDSMYKKVINLMSKVR